MEDVTGIQVAGARLSRRRLLHSSMLAGGALMATSLLAACGDDDEDEPTTAPAATATTAPSEPTDEPEEEEEDEEAEEPTAEPDPEDEDEEPAGEGVFGGTFIAALETPPPTLDFMLSTSAATRIQTRPAIEALVAVGADFAPTPMLADSWEVSDDGLTYTFALRENVPFHNGKIMTSDDVIASMERFISVTTRTGDFEIIENYEAPDEQTVVFTLTAPSLGFIDLLAFPLGYPGVLPREVAEAAGTADLTLEHIVGTGPYRLVEWVPDQLVRFERFEDYASRDEPPNGLGGGKIAYFDEMQYIPVPEAGARIAGLETGEYDYDARPSPTEYDRLMESDDVTPYINELAQMDVFYFNHADPISTDLKFRQAVQAILDMEQIAMAITNGRSDFFGLDPSIYFPPTVWHNEEGSELYSQANVDLAKQLLEESNYNGEEIIILTNRNYDTMYRNMITLDELLKTHLGINTTVEVLDWPAQIERTGGTENWHIAPTWHQSQPLFGPSAWAPFMETGSSYYYANDDMDVEFESFRTVATQEERVDVAREVQRIYYEDPVGAKICNTYAIEAMRASIKGYEPFYEPRFWNCWREE